MLNRTLNDYEASIRPEKPFSAILGGFVDGSFQFVVATNPFLAYVRHLDGFQTTAKHRNRVDLTLDPTVADNQDIPIALYYDEYGDLAIWGPDPDQGGALLQRDPNAGGGGVKLVIAGTGVAVDNTDPTRPIVSGSGTNKDLYFEDTAVSVSNSTTPTAIFSGTGPGSLALAANWWTVAGRVIEMEWSGNFSGSLTTPADFIFKVGFVGSGLTITFIFTTPAGLSGMYRMLARFFCTAPGASGAFSGSVTLMAYDANTGLSYAIPTNGLFDNPVDTTGTLTLFASVTMSVADVDNAFDTTDSATTVRYFDPN